MKPELQRLVRWFALLASIASCTPARQPTVSESKDAQSAPVPAQPPTFQLTASIRELMDSEVDPAADFLWASVASISTSAGLEERQPRTDEAWHEVRRHAITLAEATNLLIIKGRRVSATFVPAANAEELDSTEAQNKIEANWDSFVAIAQILHEEAGSALTAIDARDPSTLFDVGSDIDAVCESCHVIFWYPKRVLPSQ